MLRPIVVGLIIPVFDKSEIIRFTLARGICSFSAISAAEAGLFAL
jgi:hypothetical protein